MDYEQKYKEALERAKNLHKDAIDMGENIRAKQCEIIFPELKESEDERIRKDILAFIRREGQHIDKYKWHKWIAWLEKQGKETSWKPSKEEMDVLYGLAYITNQYDEHKEEIITRLYQDLKREFFNGSSYENMFPNTEGSVRRRSTIQVLEYARNLDNYNQYGKADIDKNIAWLKKQNGQKPFDYENCNIRQKDFAPKSAMEAIKEEKVDNANKVVAKPKFKVGNWVTNKGHSYLIADIDFPYNRYLFEIGGYTHEQLNWEYIENVDKKYHLWTIQDAKDGDVLTNKNGSVFIYKEEYMAGKPTAHCGLVDGVFHVGSGDCWTTDKCYPATKEQRDILFSKMKEAGWSWNPEIKELSQSKETTVEDKEPEEAGSGAEQSWSEEDERNLKGIIDEIEANKNDAPDYDLVTYDRFISWLKSLKQRLNK